MKTMPCVLLLTLVVTLGSTVVCAAAGPQFNVGAVNNTGGLVVFVAVDKGIFAKHGIDGKVVVRNTGPELSKALDAGEIDFGAANVSNIPVALERGRTCGPSSATWVGPSQRPPTTTCW